MRYGRDSFEKPPGVHAMTTRRLLLTGAGAAAILAALRWADGPRVAAAATYEVEKPDAEWKRLLTPEAYDVLRKHGTERPFSSPLDHEKRKGEFACAGCDLPLFASETKFDSGTGWPSFYAPIEGAVKQ